MYTLRLAQHLAQAGFPAHVISGSICPVALQRFANVSCTEYPYLDVPVWSYIVEREILNEARERKIALVHAQTPGDLPLADSIARALKAPLTVTVHDYLAPRESFRFHPRHGGRVIAVSPSVKADLVKRSGIAADAVKVIHSGVEIPPEDAITASLTAPHMLVVGTVGPLEPQKGQSYFLQAAKIILELGWDVEFIVAGFGPEETRLRRLMRELGIAGRVTFVTYAQPFAEVLAAIDVFVLPSLQQGLGTVMFEAMSQGKPVVATRVGGLSDVLDDGETARLVPPADARQLANAIIELLSNPKRARELAARGRALVAQNFNVEQMVRNTAAVYRKVLARSAALAKS